MQQSERVQRADLVLMFVRQARHAAVVADVEAEAVVTVDRVCD